MASSEDPGGLASFAESARLTPGTGGELPRTGSLLTVAGLHIEGAANGALPGGAAGIVVLLRWETHSDDTTHTHRKTAVVIRVPESIGYAPFLQFGAGFAASLEMVGTKSVEPAPDVTVRADPGIDDQWLTELLSPAFVEWLQRSPDDFGAQLADGVLVVAREGNFSDEAKLKQLCADAHKIAEEIRSEALEEVESGGGSVAKSKPESGDELAAKSFIPDLLSDGAPAHVEASLGQARRMAARSGRVIGKTITTTIAWIIGINIIGGGIYGLLLTVGDPKTNILIWQAILLVIVAPLVYRSKTTSIAKRASEQAFYEGYERANDLHEVDPLKFAAEHAEAGLPGKPVRVMEGLFGGTQGYLMLTGDGRERGEQIALVRGPKGPIAVTELNVSAPGVSTAALDGFVQTLLLDLETQPPPAGGASGAA